MVLECSTTRIRGHYEGDSQRYRDDAAPPADPLAVARDTARPNAASPSPISKAWTEEIRDRVQRAVEAARLSVEPTLQSAAEEVYAPVGAPR